MFVCRIGTGNWWEREREIEIFACSSGSKEGSLDAFNPDSEVTSGDTSFGFFSSTPIIKECHVKNVKLLTKNGSKHSKQSQLPQSSSTPRVQIPNKQTFFQNTVGFLGTTVDPFALTREGEKSGEVSDHFFCYNINLQIFCPEDF